MDTKQVETMVVETALAEAVYCGHQAYLSFERNMDNYAIHSA